MTKKFKDKAYDRPRIYQTVKKKGRYEVGKHYHCLRLAPWKHQFYGVIEKIYQHSALVRIVSFDDDDYPLYQERLGLTVIPLKRLIPEKEY
ncbi:hypothetical protein [Enterococcus songbeiensis]|uniref:hypothetical protein n=1 Tax=Enterococcus songbeiensis TaxID=2559927 RepID=UPI0010F50A77|nr:hypothetical protein [Enterococcus songbeiensis]